MRARLAEPLGAGRPASASGRGPAPAESAPICTIAYPLHTILLRDSVPLVLKHDNATEPYRREAVASPLGRVCTIMDPSHCRLETEVPNMLVNPVWSG
jgi:hypothetical protein